jgi:hypothetical protein
MNSEMAVEDSMPISSSPSTLSSPSRPFLPYCFSVVLFSLVVMPDSDFQIPPFDFYNDYELNLSTPVASPTDSDGSEGRELAIPEPSDQGPSPPPLLYTITWMMRLRKGRLMKLTDDTIEDVDIAPGAYWTQTLESKVTSEVHERVPEPQYQHHDTIITVSTSKRGEHNFEKCFRKLDIDWKVIEKKLRSWSDSKHSLRVAIVLIYQEDQQFATKKAGRGATKKHTTALEKLVTQQTGTVTGAVWQDVYRLFHCNSKNVCTNYGFYCWIYDSKHYKLDDKLLEQLVDCAEEGIQLKSHADVPERIREMIKTREMEAMQRRKRKARDDLPDRCCCRYRHSHTLLDRADRALAPGAEQVKLNLPMRIDEALLPYSDFLAADVSDGDWKASYRAAGITAKKKGYHLEWLQEEGIMPGIAEQFADREKIMEWAGKCGIITD